MPPAKHSKHDDGQSSDLSQLERVRLEVGAMPEGRYETTTIAFDTRAIIRYPVARRRSRNGD